MLLFYVVTIAIAVIALLLTLVVLLQSGQGGGLAGIASGGAARQVLGTRQAPDLLERATWTLGAALIVLCLLTNFTVSRGGEAGPQAPVTQPGQTQMPPGGNSQGIEPGGNSQGVQQPEAPAQQQENPPAESVPDDGGEQ